MTIKSQTVLVIAIFVALCCASATAKPLTPSDVAEQLRSAEQLTRMEALPKPEPKKDAEVPRFLELRDDFEDEPSNYDDDEGRYESRVVIKDQQEPYSIGRVMRLLSEREDTAQAPRGRPSSKRGRSRDRDDEGDDQDLPDEGDDQDDMDGEEDPQDDQDRRGRGGRGRGGDRDRDSGRDRDRDSGRDRGGRRSRYDDEDDRRGGRDYDRRDDRDYDRRDDRDSRRDNTRLPDERPQGGNPNNPNGNNGTAEGQANPLGNKKVKRHIIILKNVNVLAQNGLKPAGDNNATKPGQ